VNFLKFLMLLSLVLWIGGIVFFGAAVAPTAFAVLPTHHLAGNLVSRSLGILHAMGLICGIVFLASSMIYSYVARGSAQPFAPRHIAIVAMMALTLVAQNIVGARLSRMREEMGVIDNVSINDPRRVEFNRLHVWSTRLEGCVLLLGLGVLYGTARRLS
jgi:Domain of unknown function (DUF4149)